MRVISDWSVRGFLNWDIQRPIGAIDRLYYRSSPNVVFTVDNVKPYHTANKTLVPEWPCIIEVSYIYPPTTGNPDVEKSRSHAPRYDTYVPL